MFKQCFISIPVQEDVNTMLLYSLNVCMSLIQNRHFRNTVLLLLTKLYMGLKTPDYINVCQVRPALISDHLFPVHLVSMPTYIYVRIQWIEELVVQWHLPVTGRLLVQIPLYALNVMCCVHGQGLLPSFCLMTTLHIFLIKNLCVSG